MVRRDRERIMFIIPSLGSGGAERVITTIANNMAQSGYEICIILTANNQINYHLHDGVLLVKLDCENKYGHLKTMKRFIYRIIDIRNAIKTSNSDVIISFMSENNIDVCLATRGLNVPVIVSERNDPSIDPASRIKQIMRKFAYYRADGFVFQTPDAQAYFSTRIQNKSCIIFNPLTSQLPKPYTGIRDKRIVAVGRLHKQKNFPLLIDAFSEFVLRYPEYILEIYGEGPEEVHLQNLLNQVL